MTSPRRDRDGLPARIGREWRAMWRLHKWYFIVPIVLTLALLIAVLWIMGPDAVTAFIYAGH